MGPGDGDRAGLGLASVPARECAVPVVPGAFREGSKRLRKIGIVALARKLLIAFWHWVEHGVLPEGAVLETEFNLL